MANKLKQAARSLVVPLKKIDRYFFSDSVVHLFTHNLLYSQVPDERQPKVRTFLIQIY